jgi:hypothetical protein
MWRSGDLPVAGICLVPYADIYLSKVNGKKQTSRFD